MLSKKAYQRISTAIEQSFEKACKLYRPAFAALSNWMNSKSGCAFLKALEVERKIKHRGK